MNLRRLFAAGTVAVASLVAGSAQAATLYTCASLHLSPQNVNMGSVYVSVSPGDAVSWSGSGVNTEVYEIPSPSVILATASSGSYPALSGQSTLVMHVVGFYSPGATFDCTPAPASSGTTGGSIGVFGGESQAGSTFDGITDNSDGRFGSGGTQVTSNRVFVSTSGKGSGLVSPDWNAWAAVSGRNFNGTTSGNAADLVAGVDRMVGPSSLAGGLLGFESASLTDGTTPASATAPMVGVYFGTRSGSLKTDGFISVASPQVTTNGATFTSNRQSGGLSVSKDMPRGNSMLRFTGRVSGFSDAQPSYVTGGAVTVAANKISKVVASAAVRWTFLEAGKSGFTPYISGAAEYSVVSETATGVVTFGSPRFGFGISGPLGGGTLAFAVDVGRIGANTIDTGVKLRYDLKF